MPFGKCVAMRVPLSWNSLFNYPPDPLERWLQSKPTYLPVKDEELERDEIELFDTPPSSGGPILRPKQSKKLSETSSWSIASTMASTYADVTSMADTITNDEEDFR